MRNIWYLKPRLQRDKESRFMGKKPFALRGILLVLLGIQSASALSVTQRPRKSVANRALDSRAAWLKSTFSLKELQNVIPLEECTANAGELRACVQALNLGLQAL